MGRRGEVRSRKRGEKGVEMGRLLGEQVIRARAGVFGDVGPS